MPHARTLPTQSDCGIPAGRRWRGQLAPAAPAPPGRISHLNNHSRPAGS
ncbi:MAG: hypothetical protein OXU61_06660 [Gammaproteobacteria bacterium]|nr:hypothetical protein [Gammaproteobacteria bacterium]